MNSVSCLIVELLEGYKTIGNMKLGPPWMYSPEESLIISNKCITALLVKRHCTKCVSSEKYIINHSVFLKYLKLIRIFLDDHLLYFNIKLVIIYHLLWWKICQPSFEKLKKFRVINLNKLFTHEFWVLTLRKTDKHRSLKHVYAG